MSKTKAAYPIFAAICLSLMLLIAACAVGSAVKPATSTTPTATPTALWTACPLTSYGSSPVYEPMKVLGTPIQGMAFFGKTGKDNSDWFGLSSVFAEQVANNRVSLIVPLKVHFFAYKVGDCLSQGALLFEPVRYPSSQKELNFLTGETAHNLGGVNVSGMGTTVDIKNYREVTTRTIPAEVTILLS